MSAQILEQDTIKELMVDREFKNLIPPLSEEEYQLLEDNIVKVGCLNPIIVWNDVIVDGHNRYEICCKMTHPKYEVKFIEFENREEAKLWIIRNQFGRRNLQPFQRIQLVLAMKDIFSKQAKEHQRAGGGAVPQKSAKPIDTREELASLASVSHDTFSKAEKIVAEASEEDKERLKSGEISINAVYTKLKKKESHQKIQTDGENLNKLIKNICDSANKLSKIEDGIPQSCKDRLQPSLEILEKIIGVAACV